MNTKQAQRVAKKLRQKNAAYNRWKRTNDAINYSARKAGMPRHLFLMGVALGTHKIEYYP